MSGYCKILISICFLDLLSTLIGMRIGEIEEKNIYYMYFLDKGGIFGFAMAKILINSVCVFAIELSLNEKLINYINSKTWTQLTESARKKVRIYYGVAIISYCLFYIISFFAVNPYLF